MEVDTVATPKEAQQKPHYTKEPYREMAKWFERFAIGTSGTVVAQRIVSGSNLIDPLVVSGFVVAITMYTFAFILLAKS